ncbi:glycosyltransferase family 2 protein [bacterium]|nr:MAG: glycosyltransferase family 2 protein [bacterium]
MADPVVWIVMPALDEEASIGKVLAALPGQPRVVVCDNGSTDRTAAIAREAGATVVFEARRGYGQACLTALAEVQRAGAQPDDLLAFLDADFSDDPTELDLILAPLRAQSADLVIGSRLLGQSESGALLPQARWGNWLATHCIRWVTGVRFTDLGPFRALRWGDLSDLQMQDRAYGWTVEMQLKAASKGLRCVEVPVSYRRRIGQSKITGTLRGTVLASVTILSILGRWMLRRVAGGARG